MGPEENAIMSRHKAQIEALSAGETIHVNHVGCGAGEDTRGRLYLTRSRVPDNVILWYCHNCGGGGGFKWRLNPFTRASIAHPKDNREAINDLLTRAVKLEDAEDVIRECPVPVAEWLHGGVFDQNEHPFCPDMPIYYDPVSTSVVFTLGSWPNGDTGVQQRFFRKHGPKCITTMKDGDQPKGLFLMSGFHTPKSCGTLVIVEDPLSAHRIWYQASLPRDGLSSAAIGVFAMLGSDCSIEQLYKFKEMGFINIHLWMDNDNEQVLKNRERIKARAERLGFKVEVVRKTTDPKYNVPQVIDLLEGRKVE